MTSTKHNHRYWHSEQLLARALESIPLGTQTFSKSITQFAKGASPFYIVEGRGSRVWDADGNEYIDFVNDLAAILLGYADPDVTDAVEAQNRRGVAFSLPHPVEIEAAETLIEMVPCAERVRFAKNGSDVTAAAVRAARAFTGRDHVAVCGYHGWQDWYIGSTSRNSGVPAAVQALTHRFAYNDLDGLRALLEGMPGQIAAVVMEPMSAVAPLDGYLQGVLALAHEHGALLVFDEMITGFRLAPGGAQELFGVTPDLACFGKGIANGFPLSAIAGKAEVMQLFEDLFFSFTHGSEVLSLTAGLVSMRKVRDLSVAAHLQRLGQRIIDGVSDLIESTDVSHLFSISGHPSWSFLHIKASPPYDQWATKTLFQQEVFARGILTLGTHNMSFAHTDEDVDRLLAVYAEVFPLLREAVERADLESRLNCELLKPLFRVR